MSTKILGQILDELRGVKGAVGGMEAEVGGIKQALAEVRAEVKEIKDDLAEVKAEVKELKADLAEVKAEVKELKADMTDVKTRLTSLEHQFQEFRIETRTEFQVIKAGQQGIRKEIDDRFKEVNERLHRHEHIDNILHSKHLQLEADIQLLKEQQ
jgi:chromosome segregation ATPase